MTPGDIPSELKKLDRWILWKYSLIEKTGKWTKTPHSALGSHSKVDATNLANGVDYATASKAFKAAGKGKFAGLGFLLGEGIGGIDVDDCINADGAMDERGQRISARFKDTYAEVSPNKTGFKVYVAIPDVPHIGRNNGDTEIYSESRFFAVTGNVLVGHATSIASMPQAFLETAAEIGARPRDTDWDDAESKAPIGITLATARSVLDHLPFVWCDSYSEWIKSGMALHHEYSGSAEALSLWDEWSQRAPQKYDPDACAMKWETFGRPGKDEVTLRTLVRDAEATGWRAPETIARAMFDFEPESFLKGAGVGRFRGVSPKPRQWVFDQTVPAGKVSVLAGAGGTSKTFLALTLAAHYAAGKAFGPFKPGVEGAVLMLCFEEDEQDVHERYAAIVAAYGFNSDELDRMDANMMVKGLVNDRYTLARYEPGTRDVVEGNLWEVLKRSLKQRPDIRFVILDPLVLLHALEENDNNAMGHLMGSMGRLAHKTGIALLVDHHVSKAGALADEATAQAVRGAGAIVDNARNLFMLARMGVLDAGPLGVSVEDAARVIRLNHVKHNYSGEMPEHFFLIDGGSGAVLEMPQPPEPVPSGPARKVARQRAALTQAADRSADACMRGLLQLLDRGPLGKLAIHDAKPAGFSKKVIDPTTALAVEYGWVEVTVEPLKNKRLHALTTEGRTHLAGL